MLATLFTSFLSIKLVRLADRTEERVLPVPVSFILDEFQISVLFRILKETGYGQIPADRHEHPVSEYSTASEPLSG